MNEKVWGTPRRYTRIDKNLYPQGLSTIPLSLSTLQNPIYMVGWDLEKCGSEDQS